MAKRGRPTGYIMSEETKEAIRKSKIGSSCSNKAKINITNGVKRVNHPIDLERVLELNLDTCKKIVRGKYVSVYIPSKNGLSGRYMRYNVAVMTQHLGRHLKQGEDVHNLSDEIHNSVEHLVLCNRKERIQLERLKKRSY